MKNFNEYDEILNIVKERHEYTDIEKSKMKNNIIESIGSYEDYKIFEDAGYDYIMLYETEFVDLIKQKASEHDIDWGSNTIQTLITWLIQPIITKLGIKKESLIWYMLTWGLVEAAFEFKDELTRLDKKPVNWCNVFTKGASQGLLIWATSKSLYKLINILGFNISSAPDPNSIPGILQNGIVSWIKDKALDPFIEEQICENGELWDMIIDNVGGVAGTIGRGIWDVSSGIVNSIKNFW